MEVDPKKDKRPITLPPRNFIAGTWLKEANSREEGAFNGYFKGGFKMREIGIGWVR